MTLLLETAPPPTMSWADFCREVGEPGQHLRMLSPAERVVTAHLCRGLSNREIAAVLGKSPATVKNQVSAILGKIGVPTRTRLIALLR